MRVRWSLPARADLYRIYIHIAQSNPDAARMVIEALTTGCDDLISLSQRGRHSRIRGRRELVFQSLPYIAVYRVMKDMVEISRVFHSAQDW